ncbi:9520_t:CDS:2, partial [Entrophospora sp. SA101]
MPLSEIAHIDKTTQEHQNVSTINILSQSKASSSSENQTEPLESAPPTTGSFNQFSINQEKSNNASQNNSPQSQSKPKPFTCLECNQTFSRQHNLKSHALTHSKEKPYRCDVCQHFFRRQHDLKRHLKLHTGEKPHQCQHCKRKFARMDALNRHLRAETFCGGPQKKIFQGQDSKTKIELSVQQPLQQATPQQISQPQLPSSTSIIPASQPQPQPGKATQVQIHLPQSNNKQSLQQILPQQQNGSSGSSGGNKKKFKINTYTTNSKAKEVDNKPKTLQDKLLDIWKVIRFHKDGRDEDDFVNDMDLMFNNAKRYNVEGSQIYDDAVTLSKLVYKLIGGKFENEENQTYKILQEIEYKGETYFVGEYVHIYNEYDNEKPHIVHIYKLWENNKGLKGLYGCYYYRAEQTKHNLWQKFYDNEVFKTNTFQDHLIHDVLGKCCVINVNDFKTGYPKGFEGKSIYVCESRYNEISKTFNKIKNWSSLTPNDSRAPAIRFEIREIPIVLNKIESPLAAEFKAKRVKKEDSSTSEDIFSPDTNYDSQSDVPTTHSENKITESNNVPLSSARIRITSKKLSGRYKSNSSNLTIPSHHQTKSIPTNIHHNNGMVPSSYGYPNSTHIQQNPSQSHYVMSPFPSSQYYQNQQPHHYHPIGQQFTNQNITTSYTNSFAPLSSSSLQHSQNAMQVPSNVHSKVTNAKS